MEAYIILLACVFIMWKIDDIIRKRNVNRHGNFLLKSAFFVLFLLSAGRGILVGADTRNYYSFYEQIRDLSFSDLLGDNIYSWTGSYTVSLEFGYKILLYAFSHIFPQVGGQGGLALMAVVTTAFLYKAIITQSKVPWLSLWIYITMGFWQTSMNMAQNAMSIAIMLYAIKYIKQQQPYRWCFYIVLAALFHTSAIFFLPFYWLARIELNRTKTIILLGAVSACSVFGKILTPLFLILVPEKYRTYIVMNTQQGLGMDYLVVAMHISLVLLCFVCAMKIRQAKILLPVGQLYCSPYFHFFLLEILAYILGIAFPGILRVGTIAAQILILYIPAMLQYIPERRLRKVDQNMVVLFCAITYIIRMSVNNIGLTQPYEFFFEF